MPLLAGGFTQYREVWMSDTKIKSRLGLLLIRKGLLTQVQLDNALKQQIHTQQRLGEVLIEQGYITERQLNKALKKQSRHRFFAAIMAMILGPMSFGAFAGQTTNQTHDSATQEVQLGEYQGLKALDDSDLDSVQGQGFQNPQQAYESLLALAQNPDASDIDVENDLGALDELTSLLLPVTSLLDADVSVKGVKYHANNKQIVHEDGSIEMQLPAEIAEIAMRNLRVKGADASRSMGDVVISDIRFSEHSSIRIRIRQ